MLLVAACSLLAVGLGLNAHRHFSAEEPLDELEADMQVTGNRFVAYMYQPDAAIEEPPPEDDLEDFELADEASGQRHKGEEGRMGKPTGKQESGLYAMKGQRSSVPKMARNFDPELAARQVGILGQMQQESGHFLASPYGGGAFAVGNDDADVWGGLVGTGRGGGGYGAGGIGGPGARGDAKAYPTWVDQTFVRAADDAVSTFSIDVDTGSYSLVRRQLLEHGSLPAPGSVRIEEMINYFDYDYPEPIGDAPVSITTEVGPCPWDDAHQLVHVGLQAEHVPPADVPPRNLVFLVDVSGSMAQDLPLVVSSLEALTGQLDARDSIAIVVYAGASGTVLPPTSGADKRTILDALERLEAGGSTNGGAGIEHAYALARQHFVKGGINRVVLATDGDFNVGVTGHDALVELIEAKRRSGVFLSVLGFGGANYQDSTMEQLADKGNGNYAYIDGMAEARKVLVEQVGGTLVTVAKDVKLQVDFDPSVVERYRLVGYTNRVLADRDFADDTKDAGEIGSGHTVTALYEIEPKATPAPYADVMRIKIRYKEPDGTDSRLLEVPVANRPVALSDASADFRFSAAVAGFGQALQALPTSTESGPLETLRDLAADARGVDPMCRRAELVQLIERASALRGQPLEPVVSSCFPAVEPEPSKPEAPRDLLAVSEEPVPAVATKPVPTSLAPFDWARFLLEVLYLLPPLLALPLFVMALRRPRRWEA